MKIYWNRIFARFIDYGFFYLFGIMLSLVLPFDFEDSFYLLFGIATPILWAPIEALLLSKYGNTLGKSIFGITVRGKENKLLSFQQALKRVLWIGKRSEVVTMRPIPKWRSLISLVLALLCGSSLFLGENLSQAAIQFEQGITAKGWIKFADDDGRFTVKFPKKPDVGIRTFAEDSKNPLNVNEFKAEKEAVFSVNYLDLPTKWKIFSPNTLLKGALKAVIGQIPGATLQQKQSLKHKNYPAIQFHLKQGDKEIEGRLILVGETLYTLTVEYFPDEYHPEQHTLFLNSLEAKAMTASAEDISPP